MRRFLQSVAIMLMCTALACPTLEARGRNNTNNSTTEQRRPSNNANRPGNNGSGQRPGNNDNNNRPGGQHNNGNNRPGNNGNNHRPDNNGNRPSTPNRPNHNVTPSRPQHPQWNQGSHANRPRPGGGNHHFNPGPPPPRPMMPIHRPWHRPTPPPAYRPAPGWRPFGSILGVALGSAINFSINTLINSGYTVSGYGNNAIYVTNASMLNMMWPDATLFYNNGGLYASEFVYSTPNYNMNRYYNTYNMLVRNYGTPIDVTNVNGLVSSTWWGTNNQFIRLTFQSGIAGNGMTRFFTTLSFGN